jgi:phosphate transport system permease protein
LLKTGNRREAPPDFRWLVEHDITSIRTPPDAIEIERIEWGNVYGFLRSVTLGGTTPVTGAAAEAAFIEGVDRVGQIRGRATAIERGEIAATNNGLERLRLERRRLELDGAADPSAIAGIAAREAELNARYAKAEAELRTLQSSLRRDVATIETADGRAIELNLADAVRSWFPNRMSVAAKLGHYGRSLWLFLTDSPREANTEGGIFPAIFGTVMMVLLMSVLVTPFGVVAAVYLREYAHQGAFVRLIRIAVNNLAGVPSIVYGVFGLGFFVYFIGGTLDQIFFPESLPAPTFGTPGLLWASLTLALLTVPVVIVSTEEGLARIPRAVREGSLALGATKAETLFRVVLPMASPSILTGMILAIARAAGEVAPLMLVGVVKLAPTLPLDGNFPYLHVERKFMHLGFHIYDVGFQSPNVEAARPLVYATALLLVVIILVLNLTAITLRTRLERRYRSLEG